MQFALLTMTLKVPHVSHRKSISSYLDVIIESAKWPELLATLLHPEQETKNQQIMQEVIEKKEEAIGKIRSIDERNEVITDLIKVSRKPESGLLDPKVSFIKLCWRITILLFAIGTRSTKKSG